MMRGFDSATPINAEAAEWLYQHEYDFICRYYSHDTNKNLTASEAQDISNAGLLIVTVWEAQGDQYASFGTVMGTADGVAAKRQAQACGQPPGSAIFFAVDFDATQMQIDMGIADYFTAVKSALGTAYIVGSYGSPLVNASLAAKGLAARSWEAQSTGWAGDHNAPADIMQGREVTLDGINVDLDTTSEIAQRIGAWSLPPATRVQPPSPIVLPDSTEDRIKLLQAIVGAAPDGIVGPETREKATEWLAAN